MIKRKFFVFFHLYQIDLVLWNSEAQREFNDNEILILKNVKISTFCNINANRTTVSAEKVIETTMLMNPQLPEINNLRACFSQFLKSRQRNHKEKHQTK